MNEYRVRYQIGFKLPFGERHDSIVFADTAQEAADKVRREGKGRMILVVMKVVDDWK